MLGWEFIVVTQRVHVAGLSVKDQWLATWTTSLGGTDWLEKLCTLGEAIDLGGNGYPLRYVLAAATLRRVFQNGLPRADSPPVFGEDYFLPAGWSGSLEVDWDRLNALPAEVLLSVEAWDQS
jgi:hypothetical protein